MTIKEVLEEWWNSLKAFSTASWKAIRNLFSTSWSLIKEPIIVFIKAFWEWFKAIVIGMYGIFKSFIIDFITATLKMLWKSLILLYEWIKSKLNKKNKK